MLCAVGASFVLGAPIAAAQAGDVASSGYRIGARDRVKIEVYEVPDLNVEARVEADGTITLPVIGAIARAAIVALRSAS